MILHAYGDSWTEGEGCDLEIESTLKNQELIIYRNQNSWVKLLADKLNLQWINNGKSGNPNSVIFNSIIDDVTNDRIKKGDLVIILWSSSLRDYAAFLPRQQWVSWSVKHLVNLPEKFINSYKSHNETYDSFLREYKSFFLDNLFNQNYYNIVNQNYIIFLQKLFEFYGIKYVMADAFDMMVVNPNEKDDIGGMIKTKYYWEYRKKTMRDFLQETKLDCFEDIKMISKNPAQHPNVLGYNLISVEFNNYIVKNNII
jgi:hypothetical protein